MKRSFIVVAFFMLLMPVICQATPPRPGAYVTGFAGVSIPQNVDADTVFPVETFRDRVEFDPGLYIGAAGGFDFGYLRLEGELSYRYSEIKSVTDRPTGVPYDNVDGNLGVVAWMVNAFFDFHNASPITPYFGGGIGLAVLDLDDTTSNQGILYYQDEDTVFAYQVGAGLEIALNPQISLDVGYRYFGTDTGRFENHLNGFTGPTEMKFESHNALVGIRVKF